MQIFLNKEASEELETRGEDGISKGLLLPSFVTLMARLVSSFGGQPLRDINIARLIAIIAGIAVVIGIGMCIAMLLLDILRVLVG